MHYLFIPSTLPRTFHQVEILDEENYFEKFGVYKEMNKLKCSK